MITINGQSRISFFGDSRTQQGWHRYLVKQMLAHYPRSNKANTWMVFNDGLSLEKVADVSTNGFTLAVRNRRPGVTHVILWENVNDFSAGTTPATFQPLLASLVAQMTAAATSSNNSPAILGSNIIIANTMGASNSDRQSLAALDAVHVPVATNAGATLVDLTTPYHALLDTWNQDPCEFNGVHPTDTAQTFKAVAGADAGTFDGHEWVARVIINGGVRFG